MLVQPARRLLGGLDGRVGWRTVRQASQEGGFRDLTLIRCNIQLESKCLKRESPQITSFE